MWFSLTNGGVQAWSHLLGFPSQSNWNPSTPKIKYSSPPLERPLDSLAQFAARKCIQTPKSTTKPAVLSSSLGGFPRARILQHPFLRFQRCAGRGWRWARGQADRPLPPRGSQGWRAPGVQAPPLFRVQPRQAQAEVARGRASKPEKVVCFC